MGVVTKLRCFAFLRRNAAFINITSLSLGIATALCLALVARYQLEWERWWPGPNAIYQVQESIRFGGNDMLAKGVSGELLPRLLPRVPGVRATRIERQEADVEADLGRRRAADGGTEEVSFVDPDFLTVFPLKLDSGAASSALAAPGRVVLSQEMARKYFGGVSPLGRRITLRYRNNTLPLIVSGVLAPHPRNTSIETDFLTPLPYVPFLRPAAADWQANDTATYARLPGPGDVAAFRQALSETIAASPLRTISNGFFYERSHFSVVPLPSVHFGATGVADDGTSRDVVIALAAIGVLALLAAALNYVNLATAQAMGRARDVAVRKVLGATRLGLLRKYLVESLLMALAAAIPGLALTELALPLIRSLSGLPVGMDYAWVLEILAFFVLLVGLGAGFYPAVVLSSFPPAPILASARMPAQGRLGTRLRFFTVMLQFVFAVTIGICALVVNAQALHLRSRPRGMDYTHLLVLAATTSKDFDARQTALLATARGLPDVVSATIADGNATGSATRYLFHPTGQKEAAFSAGYEHVGVDFFTTFGARLLAGRYPDPARSEDLDREGNHDARHVVVDMNMVRRLGIADADVAVGHSFQFSGADPVSLSIIGVVDDMRYGSGHVREDPTIYALDPGRLEGASIFLRTQPGAMARVIAALHTAWPTLAPDIPFGPRPVAGIFADSTREDVARGELFLGGTVIAIVIACLGLYGLASLNVARRMHEIGIRKTLGATSGDVLRLLLMQFLRPIMLANIIAWPVAFAVARQWLSGFDDRIALSPTYFLAVTMLSMTLCIVTVLGRSMILARAEPSRALRAI